MIRVLYPPGCYGNYLAKCIYKYTTVAPGKFVSFDFDNHGSSHDFMYDTEAQQYIKREHYEDRLTAQDISSSDIVVSLIPDNNCNLDYTNNQYVKMYRQNLAFFLEKNFSDQLNDEFFKQWEIKNFDVSTHHWMLREWFSLWLVDSWKELYNRDIYLELATFPIEVKDLLEKFETTFFNLVDQLKLDLKVDTTTILEIHQQFLQQQTLHNSQKKCVQWIDTVLNTDSNLTIDIKTIFDEAYLQHLLRASGHEIHCTNLNVFPNSSTELKKIIYENRHNYN
jgi:hypothetical protein